MQAHILRFFWIILFSLPFLLEAQQFGIRNYSVGDGLAQSQVFAIQGDSRGFIWFGTRGGGVSRFDGINFLNYTSREGLANNYIWSIFEDHSQNMWFGTDNGMSRWDGRNFESYSFNTEQRVPVYAFAEDSLGHTWIGTGNGLYLLEHDSLHAQPYHLANEEISSLYLSQDGSLWIGQKGKISRLQNDSITSYSRSQGVPSDKIVWDFIEDENGTLWAGTYGGGLLVFDQDRFRSRLSRGPLFRGLVFDLHIGPEGNLWVATQNTGLVIYDFKTEELSLIQEQDGLPNNFIRSMWQDDWGNMWFGSSGGGVSKYYGQQFSHIDEDDGLPGKAVYSVIRDSAKRIWMGVATKGLAIYSDSLQLLNATNGFMDRKVKALHEDRDGNIWVGTEGGGLGIIQDDTTITILTTANGLSSNWIRDILEDRKGNFWLATTGNGLTRITPSAGKRVIRKDLIRVINESKGLPKNHINCLYEDKRGRIWFGTNDSGIGFIDPELKIASLRLPGGYSSNQVRCMAEDEAGFLWVGTAGGLKRVEIYSDSSELPVESFTENFNSNNVYLLGFNDEKELWIGTEKGVLKALIGEDRNIIELETYGQAEGFKGIETCQNAFFRDENGHLWFGTVDGLTEYLPEQRQEISQPPILNITNIRLTYAPLEETRFADQLGAWQKPKDTLTFLYNENHLGFDFLAVNHENPERFQYQWRLDDIEAEWSRLSSNTSAAFPNLAPGNYTFYVRACNPDGSCSPVESVSFIIEPPFWQRWWFYLACILLGIALVLLFFRMRLNQVRSKAASEKQHLEMEKDLLKLEQKSLGLQMNPHFIFNALNTIQAQIANNDPKTARYYLAKFAKLMRMVLDNSRETFIPLQQEIETLEIYLSIEQFSRDQAFTYEIEVDDFLDAEGVLIPPLLVQPFVENAIIHGVAHKTDKGHISLLFHEENEYLECVITDNGIGRKTAKKIRAQVSHTHKSTGLEVTQERLDILHQDGGDKRMKSIEFIDLEKEDGSPAGTQVKVRLPMQEEWE